MKFMVLLSLLFASLAFAQSRENVNDALAQMEKMGMSKEQISKARAQLDSLSDEEFNALIKSGEQAAKDPAFKVKAQEVYKQLKSKK